MSYLSKLTDVRGLLATTFLRSGEYAVSVYAKTGTPDGRFNLREVRTGSYDLSQATTVAKDLMRDAQNQGLSVVIYVIDDQKERVQVV
jgi:hypothetical protein